MQRKYALKMHLKDCEYEIIRLCFVKPTFHFICKLIIIYQIFIQRDDEQKTSLRIGTAEVLDMLNQKEPTVDFTLSLGADTFIDLASGKWRRTEDVFKLVGYRIVVFQRKEEENSISNSSVERNKLLQESIAKWQLINSTQSSIRVIDIPTLTEVSSSAVRRSTDETALKKMLSSEVLEYIQDKQMYALSDSK